MPTAITEVDEFTASVGVPNPGEPANAASLRDNFVQGLTNRTRWLFNKISGKLPINMIPNGLVAVVNLPVQPDPYAFTDPTAVVEVPGMSLTLACQVGDILFVTGRVSVYTQASATVWVHARIVDGGANIDDRSSGSGPNPRAFAVEEMLPLQKTRVAGNAGNVTVRVVAQHQTAPVPGGPTNINSRQNAQLTVFQFRP